VSVVRVARVLLIITMAFAALSGCMRRHPVAYAPPPPPLTGSIDAVAYGGPIAAPAPVFAAPVVAAAPVAYAAPAPMPVATYDAAYRLDAGDRLRIVVYGQEGLTNSYAVDAGGNITMPMIGAVSARGCTPAELALAIAARLRGGFIREPYVAADVEQYRPFFILGEVAAPGQYPYVPNLTAEAAVAIAGGYTPRARKSAFKLTRNVEIGAITSVVPPTVQLLPGDTLVIGERWF
jgi:polysaccharide biosynthesis/export protein